MSTPETYIPITPATRIPFPCWLWPYYPTNGWIESNPTGLGNPRYSAAELLKYGYAHYCTSATMPTGRPGEEVKAVTPEQIYFCKNCGHIFISPEGSQSQDGDVDVWCAKCGSNDDHWISYEQPAVPTASGATGEGFMQLLSGVVEAERMVVAGLSSEMPCRKMHENRHRAFREALSMAKSYFASAPDSRPAVAQEGVRDTERLDWLQENAHPKWGNESSFEVSHVHLCICAKTGVYELPKPLRAAIDAAMSSQPEGRG